MKLKIKIKQKIKIRSKNRDETVVFDPQLQASKFKHCKDSLPNSNKRHLKTRFA